MNSIIKNHDLKCLAILGSHARGDDDRNSDIDLLGIIDKKDYAVSNVKKVNLSIYSEEYLRSMMISGDLFALHVVTEGIPLVNKPLFLDICTNFSYKENYTHEKKLSFLMGSMILKNIDDIKNWNIANKRIAWCFRTYIIATMAENKSPSFSKQNISLYGHMIHPSISYEEILNAINFKHRNDLSKVTLSTLRKFLDSIVSYMPSKNEEDFLYATESILLNTSNQMTFDFYQK